MASKSKKQQPRRIHYILSTHWDREWYQTYQDYRRRLVGLLDRILDDIHDGALQGSFILDGQSIPLEDYLEIRPERRPQVEQFMATGQLKAGPWYVLPDEWLVSGESLIRNLELGRRIAREFGGVPSNAGFVCDLFGHISQLPQILKGFHITGGLIWRGIEPRRSAHVLWRGADGTELPCYRFGRSGYCDYTVDVRHATEYRHTFNEEGARADLKAFLDKEASRTSIPPILLFDGADHIEYDADHYQALLEQARGAEFPYQLVHSTLDAYLEEMLLHRGKIKEIVEGELREAAQLPNKTDQQWLIPGVLSSRVWIKQANAACQTLLCQWAEPFSSAATAFLGTPYPERYLQTSWKWLLQNHPHDSICGCSIDEVHEDMKYRFAQCRQIASAQADESLRSLAMAIEGKIGEKELRVVVANPLASLLDEPVDLVLQIPAEWGTYQEFFGFEPKAAFRIYDDAGREIPYQLLRQEMNRTQKRIHPLKFPETYKVHHIAVSLRLVIPALGYRTLTIHEGERNEKDGPIPALTLPTRHSRFPSMVTSERSMENEFLSVLIESNGTLTVTDKRHGTVYRRLLTFEDIADIGDGWFHGPAVNDQCFVSTGSRADIALVQDGPHLARFRIRVHFELPKEFLSERHARSEQFVSILLDNLVTLRAGVDRIEISTTLENSAKDHRLRVLFPSGAQADTYLADGAFDVVERKIQLPAEAHQWRELPVETTPQQSWTAIADAKRGLAIVSEGLMESTVRDQPERPIALTLFRSTGRTVMTDGEPNGQLLGPLSFRYWIVPLAGRMDRRRLFDQGQYLAAGLRTIQLRPYDLEAKDSSAVLPSSASLLKVNGSAVVTSARHSAGALVIRLFNPASKEARASVDFSGWPNGMPKPKSAVHIDFEGNPTGAPEPIKGNIYHLRFMPKEIVTLRFARVI